jgi:hypothetical protein
MSMSSDDQIIGEESALSKFELFLVSLAQYITHVSGKMFGSDSVRWIILLFVMYCLWQPAYQFSAAIIQDKSILISIPLLIQFAVGIITLKVAINWGHSNNG